jgi:hypothetical protein
MGERSGGGGVGTSLRRGDAPPPLTARASAAVMSAPPCRCSRAARRIPARVFFTLAFVTVRTAPIA